MENNNHNANSFSQLDFEGTKETLESIFIILLSKLFMKFHRF